MKLYGVNDGPPSLAVRMALKALDIPFELVDVDFIAMEHMTDDYAKVEKVSLIHNKSKFVYIVDEPTERDSSSRR